MPHFVPTLKNMARTSDEQEFGFSRTGTKKWFVDHYLGGLDKLKTDFAAMPNLNPASLGDDYNIEITISDPDKLFGINYKKLKWMASDIDFGYYTENPTDEDKLSFWFIETSKTRWVYKKDEERYIPVVSFILKCDILLTFAHIIYNLHGQFYYKRTHFDRWVFDFMKDKDGNDTKFMRAVPNFQGAPALMNCNSFCQNKNQKVHTPINLAPQTTELSKFAVVIYSVPLDRADNAVGAIEGVQIYYSDDKYISYSFAIAFVYEPDTIVNDTNLYDATTKLQALLGQLEQSDNENEASATIHTVYYTTLNLDKVKSYCYEDTYGFFPSVVATPTLDRGGKWYKLPYDLLHHEIYYEDNDNFFTADLAKLTSETINPDNEVHLGMGNHREIKLAVADKTPQIIDQGVLFRKGNPLVVDTTTGKIVLKTEWWDIFDAEYGGRIGYVENTATDLQSSIYTSRNFIDFTGTINIPYRTDTYLENMQTRQNQKQASYDNNNITRDTGNYINNQKLDQDIVHTTAQAIRDTGALSNATAASGSIWGMFNPGKALGGVVQATSNLIGNTMENVSATITNNNIRNAQVKNQFETTKNSLDGFYADLTNSPSNVHPTGKITSLSMIYKSIIANNEDKMFTMHWFKNEIIEIDRYQIAFDMNKYGYTCDWITDRHRLEDFMTRRLWTYHKIINMKEMLKNIMLDPDVVDAIDKAFTTGVMIWRLDAIDDVIEIDYNQNNYELALLQDGQLDAKLDYLLME